MTNIKRARKLANQLIEVLEEQPTEVTTLEELIDEYGPGINDFAERIDVHRVQIHRWLKAGRIPEGAAWKIQAKLSKEAFDAEAYLAAQ